MSKQKYVKLNPEQTEWASALHFKKPRQVARFSDAELPTYHWYPVKEEYSAPLGDNEIYEFKRQGWSVADGIVTITYAPELKNVEIRREVVINRINAYRDAHMRAGLSYNGNPIDSDEITLVRVIGLTVKAMKDQETFSTSFVTQDNQTITLNAAQVIELGESFGDFETQHILVARQLKDQAAVSDNPETIDFENAAWPDGQYGVAP